MSDPDHNKAMVLAFADAYSRSDWDGIRAICTPDFRWVVPAVGKMQSSLLATYAGLSGDRSLREMLEVFEYATGNCENGRMTLTIGTMIAEGDKVAAEAQSHAVSRLTGRTYANLYLYLLSFRDGKLSEFREYQDTLHAFDVWMAP
jgi:ketosteroid isomerase-like protein